MTKKTTEPEIVKREVDERVKLSLHFDKELTKDLGEGEFEAVITTSSTDRHNESIVTEGIDTDGYMEKNPVVLYGHDYWGMPIGKTLSLKRTKNKITAKFKLAVEEYEFAASVAAMIKSGFLNAVSIGGIVKEWSEDYRTILQMEMLEFSIVTIPANGEAMITARSFEEATGKSMEEVGKEYAEFQQGNVLDKVKHMPDDDLNQSIKAIESLLAILKESSSAPSSAGDAEPTEAKRTIKRVRVLAVAKAINQESERTIRLIKLK